MISVNDKCVSFRGTKVQLHVDVCTLLQGLVRRGVFDKKDLMFAVDLACMADEELHKEAQKATGDILSTLIDAIGKDTAGDMLRSKFNVEDK